MPRRLQNVVQNFAAGVLSPRLSAAVDKEAFVRGLREAKNFIISTQGGAVYREGFEFISLAISNQKFRVFQFRRGGDISDILIEVSAGHIRYWFDDGGTPVLLEDNVTLLIDEDDDFFLVDEDDGYFLTPGVLVDPNPYSVDDLDTLYFTNQDRFGIICHERHPTLYITSYANGLIKAEQIAKERIPIYKYPDLDSPNSAAAVASWRITFPEQWLSYPLMYFMVYNGVIALENEVSVYRPFDATVPQTNIDNMEYMLNAAAVAQGLTGITFTVTSVSQLVYDVAVSGESAGYDIGVGRVGPWYWGSLTYPGDPIVQQSNIDGVDPLEEPAWSYPAMVLHNGVYYQCVQVHTSSAETEPGVGALWDEFWDELGIGEPVGWSYQYPIGNDWAIDTVYAPLGRGFPTVCVFHEQRLILCANPANPTAIYGSKIGAFNNFVVGPNDDEAWIYVLDSSDTPEIKWAQSQRTLVLGTSSGEWAINAAVTITPTDIQAEQQNSARSQLAMPSHVDTDILYIEQGGRKLRLTEYTDDRSNTFSSTDISAIAEHLISTEGIHRIASSFIPETQVVMLRKNGQPVSLTVDRASQVLAYSEYETDGFVYDVASYFTLDTNADYMFYAVQRNGNWVLERMRYPCSKLCFNLQEQNVVHMDGWVTGTVAGTVITGLEHLNGKRVGILIDDAWQIGEYTVANGAVQLAADETGKTYAVGLVYTGTLQTMESNVNFQGEGLGTKRRWNRLWTRILNSALPEVYNYRASDRRPATPMGTSDNVRDGIHDINQNTTGFKDGSITVIHDRPYPLYLVGFYGQYQVEEQK